MGVPCACVGSIVSGCSLQDRILSGPWCPTGPTLWDISSHGVKRHVPRRETRSPTSWDQGDVCIGADGFLCVESHSTVFFFALPERDRVSLSLINFSGKLELVWKSFIYGRHPVCLWHSVIWLMDSGRSFIGSAGVFHRAGMKCLPGKKVVYTI